MVSVNCTVYTDPLCCWSWAFEPQLKKLKATLGEHANWTLCMGGLIPSWNNYHDEVNSVTRPVQMGPVWMHAGQVAQQPINHILWIKDPPDSSYPSCIAVKSAQLQSAELGESFLQKMRNAAMTDGKNISRSTVITEIAEQFGRENPAFDIMQFISDYNGGPAQDAFRKDLLQVQYYRINRFPTLVIGGPNDRKIIVSGYKSYETILNMIDEAFTLFKGSAK